MAQQHFQASRRAVLLGASAVFAAAPIALKAAVASAVTDSVTIADLVDGAGQATERARTLAGQAITLKGYPAPAGAGSVRALMLSAESAAPCQLCGSVHESAAIAVDAKEALPANLSMLRMVEASGRLAIDGPSGIRLADAVVRTI